MISHLRLRSEIERQRTRISKLTMSNKHLCAEVERLTRELGEALSALQRRADQLNVLQGSISAYHTGELERQVATLREALNWFADKNNWREEQLSEGYVYSAEWRVGFSPIDMATRALAETETDSCQSR